MTLLWGHHRGGCGRGAVRVGGALETRLGLLPERGPHSVRPSRPFTAAIILRTVIARTRTQRLDVLCAAPEKNSGVLRVT